jgi:hypothetical protein
MRKLLSALVAVIFSGGIAASAFIPFLTVNTPAGVACAEPSQSLYCYNQILGTINSYLGLVGALPGPIASTATTAEQVLASTSIPGGTLSVPGQSLRLHCGGISAANTDSKLARLYFGNAAISTGAFTTSAANWELELLVMLQAPTTSMVYIGRGSLGSAVTVSPIVANDLVDNPSLALTAKCTVTQSAATAGEMTEELFSIEQVK